MNHNLWLLKHWPKEDQPNLDPVIYCLEEEFNEEQAIKVLFPSSNNQQIQLPFQSKKIGNPK